MFSGQCIILLPFQVTFLVPTNDLVDQQTVLVSRYLGLLHSIQPLKGGGSVGTKLQHAKAATISVMTPALLVNMLSDGSPPLRIEVGGACGFLAILCGGGGGVRGVWVKEKVEVCICIFGKNCPERCAGKYSDLGRPWPPIVFILTLAT